jgi:hypothetical protein
MPDIDSTLKVLNQLWARVNKAEEDRRDLMQSGLPQAMKDEQDKAALQQIAKLKGYQEELLRDIVRFPPYAVEHFTNLDQFHQASPYAKSVFVMTKFPGTNSPLDAQLSRVIKAVRDSVATVGFKSHMACDKTYNPMLWKNVEFYLLACGKGIAIVESKHTPELNPNVTMEWGWMRGMDRQVLFLVEKSFDKSRADLSGLIEAPFYWDNPEKDIENAVKKFLV